jgi:hypothetical protein
MFALRETNLDGEFFLTGQGGGRRENAYVCNLKMKF